MTRHTGPIATLLLSLACGALTAGCRSPAAPPGESQAAPPTANAAKPAEAPSDASKPTPAANQAPAAAGEAAADRSAGNDPDKAVDDELSRYRDRRKQRPAVIGGCRERCETPEAAVANFLDRLQRRDDSVDALHECFEWSLLMVDGEPHGERWANQWARPAAHAKRREEIEGWLQRWSSFAREASAEALAKAAAATSLQPASPGVVDRSFLFRPPPRADGTPPRGEATWRLTLHQRGHEWLIREIQHHPSQPPARRPRAEGHRAPLGAEP